MKECSFNPSKISEFDFSFEEKDAGKWLYNDAKLWIQKKQEIKLASTQKIKIKKSLWQLERLKSLYVTKDQKDAKQKQLVQQYQKEQGETFNPKIKCHN